METIAERIRSGAEKWRADHPRAQRALTLLARTAGSLMRARVVGLAAEAAFFSLLSLPALLLGLVGTLGHLTPVLGAATVYEIRAWLLDLAATALTDDTVDDVVAPLVDEFLGGAQGGILSVTFLVSLWSGSRAMNVFIEAITIAYGLDDLRGYIRQRALAFVAYLGGLLFALVLLPVLVAGPGLIRDLLPATSGYLGYAYWPVVGFLSTLAVTLLYVLSTPVRTPLWRYLPGALVAMAVLLLGSVLLRLYLDASFGQVTIYGSLAAPIALLAWLWLMALAVLVGSVLNAETDAMWPTPATAAARARIAARRQERAARMVERHERALRTSLHERGADGARGGAPDDAAAGRPAAGAPGRAGPEAAETPGTPETPGAAEASGGPGASVPEQAVGAPGEEAPAPDPAPRGTRAPTADPPDPGAAPGTPAPAATAPADRTAPPAGGGRRPRPASS
ncbi:YihY/virulence factor BrkB family protein [Nocardiopsis trehalosi]|uniref:YihY/virulence factor BrkB family protein n=1 Tax=Nocardiopsis trehalosi TaxID=109329 RepID=UPI000ACDC382